MCKFLPMKTIAVPIGEARTNLFELVEQTKHGVRDRLLAAHEEELNSGTPPPF
jgi:hypothetical protein